MKSKKGLELSLNTIITAVIIIVILFFLILLLTGQGGKLFSGLKNQVDNIVPLANSTFQKP